MSLVEVLADYRLFTVLSEAAGVAVHGLLPQVTSEALCYQNSASYDQ